MADKPRLKDSSSTQVNSDSSDSCFEINIKTVDLHTYSFCVNKHMSISALKEDIVTKIGVPIEEQQLLYEGMILNNDQLLSELNLEEGDILYLVERQPVQSQPSSSTVVPDTSRTSSSQGAGAESCQNISPIQSDNSANGEHILLQQALPSIMLDNMPYFPMYNLDALTTISTFTNEMERMLQSSSNVLNTGQHQTFWTNTTTEFLNTRSGMPTPELLSFVLARTEQFLRDSVTTNISNLSTRLKRADRSSDPVLRGQIQLGAVQLGVAMQELGAMFLELGRVTMCLRMGQTSEESFVNAGPAIYISPTGPNPTMAQLFPSQSSYPSGTNNPAYLRIEQPVPIRPAFQAQSSSNAMQSGALQNFLAVMRSETLSDMSNMVLEPPGLPNLITHATQMNGNELSDREDLFFGTHTVNDGMTIEDLLLSIINDGASDDSQIVVGSEDGKQSGSGEIHDSDFADSGSDEQQVMTSD